MYRISRRGWRNERIGQNEIEKQVQELENETSDELKQQYLIAKSKKDALEATYYEKI